MEYDHIYESLQEQMAVTLQISSLLEVHGVVNRVETSRVRGCSHFMSAKNGEAHTPPPPLVSQRSEDDLPPSPLVIKSQQ